MLIARQQIQICIIYSTCNIDAAVERCRRAGPAGVLPLCPCRHIECIYAGSNPESACKGGGLHRAA